MKYWLIFELICKKHPGRKKTSWVSFSVSGTKMEVRNGSYGDFLTVFLVIFPALIMSQV